MGHMTWVMGQWLDKSRGSYRMTQPPPSLINTCRNADCLNGRWQFYIAPHFALYNIGSASWLAWANDIAAHYEAVHCSQCSIALANDCYHGAAGRHTTAPPPRSAFTALPVPLMVGGWVSLSTRWHFCNLFEVSAWDSKRKLKITSRTVPLDGLLLYYLWTAACLSDTMR